MTIEDADPRNWTIHRNSRGWPRWYQRWLEAFWIVTGRWSLHRAWRLRNGIPAHRHQRGPLK